MKLLLFLLCSLFATLVMAQDCTRHALMQKGTQLEYKEYTYRKVYSFNKDSGFFPVLRLLFNVDQVKDSAGVTFSTITKKGFGIKDEIDHYERKLILQCDGKNLRFPYDFYESDTVYTRDHYPPGLKIEKHGWAVGRTFSKDAITYIVPLVMDCIVGLPEGKKQVEKSAMFGESPPIIHCINPFKYSINIKSIALQGKVLVTTPAGAFYCYKFYVDSEVKLGHVSDIYSVNYWLYFNEEIGLVKIEDTQPQEYYVELTSINKPFPL